MKEGVKIYRRYQPTNKMPPMNNQNKRKNQDMSASLMQQEQKHSTNKVVAELTVKETEKKQEKQKPVNTDEKRTVDEKKSRKNEKQENMNILRRIIPASVYNPQTEKILGVFSPEDLLLVALIFLFMENNEDDDTMLIFALIYILLADYIDFSKIIF